MTQQHNNISKFGAVRPSKTVMPRQSNENSAKTVSSKISEWALNKDMLTCCTIW